MPGVPGCRSDGSKHRRPRSRPHRRRRRRGRRRRWRAWACRRASARRPDPSAAPPGIRIVPVLASAETPRGLERRCGAVVRGAAQSLEQHRLRLGLHRHRLVLARRRRVAPSRRSARAASSSGPSRPTIAGAIGVLLRDRRQARGHARRVQRFARQPRRQRDEEVVAGIRQRFGRRQRPLADRDASTTNVWPSTVATRRHMCDESGVMMPRSSAATSVTVLTIDPGSTGVSRMSARASRRSRGSSRLRTKKAAPALSLPRRCPP